MEAKEDSSDKLLSILIPTIDARYQYLNRLLHSLDMQIIKEGLDNIEILVYSDNLENSIGYKSNVLIEQAKGKYIVGIGDDDTVSEDYIKQIIDVISEKDVDQVVFPVEYKKCVGNKCEKKTLYHSNKFKNFVLGYNKLFKIELLESDGYKFNGFLSKMVFIIFNKFIKYTKFYTWTWMVVKREIANKVKFSVTMDSGEDFEWAAKVAEKDYIKTEHIIDKVLYYYDFDEEISIRHGGVAKELDYEIKEIKTPIRYIK